MLVLLDADASSGQQMAAHILGRGEDTDMALYPGICVLLLLFKAQSYTPTLMSLIVLTYPLS